MPAIICLVAAVSVVAETLEVQTSPSTDGHVLDTNYFGISELDGEGDCVFPDHHVLNTGCLSVDFLSLALTVPYEEIDPGLTSFPSGPFLHRDAEVCVCINQEVNPYPDCVDIDDPGIPLSGSRCSGFVGITKLVTKFDLVALPDHAQIESAELRFAVQASGSSVDIESFAATALPVELGDYCAPGEFVALNLSAPPGDFLLDVTDAVRSAQSAGIAAFRMQVRADSGLDLEPGLQVGLAEDGEAPTLSVEYSIPEQIILIESEDLSVEEGRILDVPVRLAFETDQDVPVLVERVSGDTDIVLLGDPLLVFHPEDYDVPRTLRILAIPDADYLPDETTFRLTAPHAPPAPFTVRVVEAEAPPSRLYVNAGMESDGDGGSWGEPFRNLSDAIELARTAPGIVSEIWVAAGVYLPGPLEAGRNQAFDMPPGLTIYGGFAGTETSPDQRSEMLAGTVLSGDLAMNDGTAASAADNVFHVVRVTEGTLELDGVTIEGGNSKSSGGGIQNLGGDLHLANCTIRGCRASNGGAVYNEGFLLAERCVFAGNTATSLGGALLNASGSSAQIRESLFEGNTVTEVFLYGGGAVYNGPGSAVELLGVEFIRNSAVGGALGGALYNHNCDTVAAGCRFFNNFTENDGGAIANLSDGSDLLHHAPSFFNCTIVNNFAVGSGAGMVSTGVPGFVANSPIVRNSIIWGNLDSGGADLEAQVWVPFENAGQTDISFSCVQFGWPGDSPGGTGTDNIQTDPRLTPDGHLRAISPCIDAGDPAFPAEAPMDFDIDGDPRINNSRIDMGADEFTAGPGSVLPTWWVEKYGDGPLSDADQDGLNSLEEYELASSNPISPPIFVDPVAGDDSWDGLSATPAPGTGNGPKSTVAAALEVVPEGGTVLLQPGVYAGGGNAALDPPVRSMVIRSSGGADDTVMDGSSSVPTFLFDWRHRATTLIDGLTFQNGPENLSGSVRFERGAAVSIRGCKWIVPEVAAPRQGVNATQSMLTWSDVSVEGGGTADPVYGVESPYYVSRSVLSTDGLLIRNATFDLRSSTLQGPGQIRLGEGGRIAVRGHMDGTGEILPSTLNGDLVSGGVEGAGELYVAGDGTLFVDGNSIIDLGGTAGGTIRVEGALIVRDDAVVRNSNMEVVLLGLSGDTDIVLNNITLRDINGFGGQFFVEGNASILNNVIVAEGDRYLDFDPDPTAPTGLTIAGNTLKVHILEGTQGQQGTLLELRGLNYECALPDDCPSGAYEVDMDSSEGFTAENWVLDELVVFADAKVNLTNRQGFVFQSVSDLPESLYAKKVVLYPGAVVNTGLQNLFYGELVDEAGNPLVRDPDDPFADLGEGRRFEDIPLLGFSLVNIAMEDQTEFEVRVKRRFVEDAELDLDDPSIPAGVIERIDTNTHGGVMEMCTRRPGHATGVPSVTARGSFARAGDEDVTVTFRYLFREAPDPENTALHVRVSGNPFLGADNEELGLVVPPPARTPGGPQSEAFVEFKAVFPAGLLNFSRGTYVELELAGTDACVWIDDWDPVVACSATCGDLNGQNDLDELDFLVLLAEIGQEIDSDGGCADSKLNLDGYADLYDVLGIDMFLSGAVSDACYSGGLEYVPFVAPGAGVAPLPDDSSIILGGKNAGAGFQEDVLVATDVHGRAIGVPMDPPSMPLPGFGHRGNGKLIRDSAGMLYQIHATQGIVRLDDGTTLLAPGTTAWEGLQVTVGPVPVAGALRGLPILDADFDPMLPDEMVVAPVVVDAGGCPYRAAAKIRLDGGAFEVLAIYGDDPRPDWSEPFCPAVVYQPEDVQAIREVGLDDDYVYVLAARRENGNDWLIIYDSTTGAELTRTRVNESAEYADAVADIPAPASMLVVPGFSGTRIYVTSGLPGAVDGSAVVCAFHVGAQSDSTPPVPTLVGQTHVQAPPVLPCEFCCEYAMFITSLLHHPVSDGLEVFGFVMPRIGDDVGLDDAVFSVDGSLLALPVWAVIPAENLTDMTEGMVPSGLVLGTDLSLVYTAQWAQSPQQHSSPVEQRRLAVYQLFQNCIGGGPGEPVPAACRAVNAVCDGEIDLADHAVLGGN